MQMSYRYYVLLLYLYIKGVAKNVPLKIFGDIFPMTENFNITLHAYIVFASVQLLFNYV